MPAVWAFLKAVPVWAYIALALVIALGVQTLRLDHAQNELAGSELSLKAVREALNTQNDALTAKSAADTIKANSSTSALDGAKKAGSGLRKQSAGLLAGHPSTLEAADAEVLKALGEEK